MTKKTDCPKCYGTPCVCKEIEKYVPIWTCYMWEEKEKIMIPLNDIPMHPKLKRMWDNSVPLK
jgi:hypothetical protein